MLVWILRTFERFLGKSTAEPRQAILWKSHWKPFGWGYNVGGVGGVSWNHKGGVTCLSLFDGLRYDGCLCLYAEWEAAPTKEQELLTTFLSVRKLPLQPSL